LLTSVWSLTQLWPHWVKPELHPHEHTPALQVGAAFCGAVHVWPHPPQLLTSAWSLTHAVGAEVGQPVNPESQAKPHEPPLHVGAALAMLVVHALLHVPQWFGSDCRFSHALGVLQYVSGAEQDPVQAPALHTAVPFVTAGHALPHAPQLLASFDSFAQYVGEAEGQPL
jgi:hypothetical protein